MIVSNKPLVSVICTAYNHEGFIREALESVINQSYESIELIVIDNASTDASRTIIEGFSDRHPSVQVVTNSSNLGLCKAFNQGLALASGKYVVDLSADDVLSAHRIERQVAFFEQLPDEYGVIFSNARFINAKGHLLHHHYETNEEGKAKVEVPSGDVYRNVLERYFICTPTMMMRRSLLDRLGGYDEALAFEDFDFWVRSAIISKYAYQDEILTYKRLLANSLSLQVFKPGSGILESTYVVCNKAYDLNRNQEDFDQLAKRIRTFIRKCLYAQEFELGIRFRKLLNYIEDPDPITEIFVLLCRMRLPVNGLYRVFRKASLKFISGRKDFRPNVVLFE